MKRAVLTSLDLNSNLSQGQALSLLCTHKPSRDQEAAHIKRPVCRRKGIVPEKPAETAGSIRGQSSTRRVWEANKGPALHRQEVWKVNCRETHLVEKENHPPPISLWLGWHGELGSCLVPTHPGLQAGGRNFHLSCTAKSQTWINWSICLLLSAPKQPNTPESRHQADWFHCYSGSPTPPGLKGG